MSGIEQLLREAMDEHTSALPSLRPGLAHAALRGGTRARRLQLVAVSGTTVAAVTIIASGAALATHSSHSPLRGAVGGGSPTAVPAPVAPSAVPGPLPVKVLVPTAAPVPVASGPTAVAAPAPAASVTVPMPVPTAMTAAPVPAGPPTVVASPSEGPTAAPAPPVTVPVAQPTVSPVPLVTVPLGPTVAPAPAVSVPGPARPTAATMPPTVAPTQG